MGTIAEWQGKKFEVTPIKAMGINDLSTSYTLRTETLTDENGGVSYVESMEPVPLSFSSTIGDAVGVNVQQEIDAWRGLVGKAGPFILGGRRFGPEKMQLQKVDVSDVLLDDIGRMRKATLQLDYLEKVEEAAKDKPRAAAQQVKSAQQRSPGIAVSPSTYTTLGLSSAIGIGAKTSDKIEKKSTNLQMKNAEVAR